MKRILVPTDFSATAERAFRFAADIASKTGGSITLYHVYIPEEIPFADTEEKRKEYNKQLEATQLKRLQTIKKESDGRWEGSNSYHHSRPFANHWRHP